MSNTKKVIHFPLESALHPEDNEFQTYGCRYYNPDICKNNGDLKCAFVNKEHICKSPSKKWASVYRRLKDKETFENQ